jgi:uncharacterized protein YrrD
VSGLATSGALLSKGTDVVDSTGDKIANMDDFLFDDKNTIEECIAQQGHVLRHDVRAPMVWVAGITDQHVRLNVLSGVVERSRAESLIVR